jgi:aryl-alcohol dehydrogenase-like predicted oxidoreductase
VDVWRRTNPRFTEGNFEKNLRVDEVEAVASEVGATPAQVALAWLLAQGDDIAPIPAPSAFPASRRTRQPTASS